MPLLSQDEITNLIAEYPTQSDKWLLVREAVRLAAERCAAICDAHMGYEMEERAADACAQAIREAAK